MKAVERNYKLTWECHGHYIPGDESGAMDWKWFDNYIDAWDMYKSFRSLKYHNVVLYARTTEGWEIIKSKNISLVIE